MNRLIVNYATREKRLVLMMKNHVEKIVIDRPEHHSLVGNIYYGTVTKVLPGMNAVFVDIGEEKKAYLHRNLLPKYVLSKKNPSLKEKESVANFVHQGEKLLVQVNKDETGTKGARLTGIIELQGNHLILMPNGRYVAVSKKIAEEDKNKSLRHLGMSVKEDAEGIIFRTSSMDAFDHEIKDELEQLREQYLSLLKTSKSLKAPGILFQKESFIETIMDTIRKMPDGEVLVDDLTLKKRLEAFDHVKNGRLKLVYFNGKENVFTYARVEHEVEKALKRIVWLENGAYLIFDETEALTIIDVNTGKFSGKHDLEDTILKTNQAAAIEIARQLRLRDIGGMVLIDFIDMNREQGRLTILEIFERELGRDEKRTKVIGFTPLGILQLTRKKTKITLSEGLQMKCPECAGTGRVDSAETVAFRLERELFEHRHSEFEAVLVETTAEVIEVFDGPDKNYRSLFEELTHLKVFFTPSSKKSPFYSIKQFGTESEISLGLY
ncbi:MAG: Rne/Rng family ribonuclease [Bacillota bacterium]|nr:Rne/Rng family ribonuclease [Bacillota bacterium]